MNFEVTTAEPSDVSNASAISLAIAESAKERGIGIAKRSPAYISEKIQEGKAVIAKTETGELAGFCYIETWSHNQYVANSGLIILPKFRGLGLARQIKKAAYELSLEKFPGAKLFGLTTNLAVMKINSELGYRPVTFSELTQDKQFWSGCEGCINFEILKAKKFKNCLCTGMLLDPAQAWAKKVMAGRKKNEEKSSASV